MDTDEVTTTVISSVQHTIKWYCIHILHPINT